MVVVVEIGAVVVVGRGCSAAAAGVVGVVLLWRRETVFTRRGTWVGLVWRAGWGLVGRGMAVVVVVKVRVEEEGWLCDFAACAALLASWDETRRNIDVVGIDGLGCEEWRGG